MSSWIFFVLVVDISDLLLDVDDLLLLIVLLDFVVLVVDVSNLLLHGAVLARR